MGWCLKFAEVPGARPEAHNSQFFWMGFWLLGLLPVFQPPMKAGAKSGEALKFAKVPGARPGGLNAQFFWMGFWLLGLLPVFQPPILRREQIRAGLSNLPKYPEPGLAGLEAKMPIFFGWASGYWVCYQSFSRPLRREQIRAGLWNLSKYPEPGLEAKMPNFFGLVSGYWVCYQFFSLPLRREQIRAGL